MWQPVTFVQAPPPPPPPPLPIMQPPTIAGPTRPSWMASGPFLAMWAPVLADKFGCDEESIMELACLAQLSPAGYEGANTVVSKMLKKLSDGETFNNPSFFLHSACLAARHRISPDPRA